MYWYLENAHLGKESRRLQLRFEAQNLLIHMNAGNPDSGVTSLTVGQIINPVGATEESYGGRQAVLLEEEEGRGSGGTVTAA